MCFVHGSEHEFAVGYFLMYIISKYIVRFLGQTTVFQTLQIALILRTRVILIVFDKLTSGYFFPNCTRNRTTTSTLLGEVKTFQRKSKTWLYVLCICNAHTCIKLFTNYDCMTYPAENL